LPLKLPVPIFENKHGVRKSPAAGLHMAHVRAMDTSGEAGLEST
jgi:hypothetical protein